MARSMIESGHGKKSVSGFLFYEKISYKGKDILCVMENLLLGVCFEMYRKLYKENTYNLRLLNLNFTKWSYDKQVKIDTQKY